MKHHQANPATCAGVYAPVRVLDRVFAALGSLAGPATQPIAAPRGVLEISQCAAVPVACPVGPRLSDRRRGVGRGPVAGPHRGPDLLGWIATGKATPLSPLLVG